MRKLGGGGGDAVVWGMYIVEMVGEKGRGRRSCRESVSDEEVWLMRGRRETEGMLER